MAACGALLWAAPAAAQTTGSVLGRVFNAQTGEPLASAQVRVLHLPLGTLTAPDGRFVLAAVPAGERDIRVELIGYQPVTLERLQVRAGRSTEVRVELRTAAVELPGVVAQAERIRLIEPEVSATHDVVVGRELRELPVDAVADAVELAPGVSEGHFRGGRLGQEVYVIDGLELKNQLEASTQGLGIEFSPTSLEEIEVLTGGFGAEYGSALSGVVSYVTRRGNPEAWEARASFQTDHWVPTSVFRGFTGVSASAGGPVPLLGRGTTVFADVLAQGMLDAEPRARGLTCLRQEDGGIRLAEEIQRLERDRNAAHLYCPYSGEMLPHQQGEKLIAFLRFDRPITDNLSLTTSVLRNRLQRQLYTPAFKYNPLYQIGQRSTGTLGNIAVDWIRHRRGRAYHITARGAAFRLDRYLGVLDPASFNGRTRIAGFGFSNYEFLGEDFVRQPVETQLELGLPVPGYLRPGGTTGSPFGPAAEGIFFTEGTPDLANWSRSEFVGGDLVGELFSAQGHALRTGGSTKFYRVESYERVLAYLPGSAPNYALFYPAIVNGFAEVRLAAADEVTVQLGVRVEAFRSGLTFRADRNDFLAPVIETQWKSSVMPRIGVAAPVPGTNGRTAFRFNYGLVAQPPDFRYFLDTTLGDSLRTDIRRQGNPDLTFERGASYEIGLTHLLNDYVSLGAALFRKQLRNLVTGSLVFSGYAQGQFTTGDFGTVHGVELTMRARWREFTARAGYALQKATGVVSTALDTAIAEPGEVRTEFPLAFDRRHAMDVAVFAGRAADIADKKWGAVLTATLQSGYPIDRLLAAGAVPGPALFETRLPWTAVADLRASYEIGALPGCGDCRWRVVFDGRNIFDRENVIALRRDNGLLAPPISVVNRIADDTSIGDEPIPRESPRYSELVDLNGDGLVTAGEFRAARFAAALDRFDPSLFFGEARQLRLGIEVSF